LAAAAHGERAGPEALAKGREMRLAAARGAAE